MRRILKWAGIGLAGLIALLAVLVGVLYLVGSNRLNRGPDIAVQTVEIPTDPEALREGARLATISSCNGCHGADLGGDVFIDSAPIGYMPAPNLTSGAGGIGATYTVEDWARAIRHGAAADGRPIAIMPSYYYTAYSDEDLGALIAYLQSLNPVDREFGARRIDFLGTIIFGVFAFDDATSIGRIDHAAVGGSAPPVDATAVYGEYVAKITGCGSCHGADLGGSFEANGPTGPNITLGGELGSWREEDFFTALRTGMTPSGRQLDTEMPWPAYTLLTDTEVAALWAYLQSIPAVETP